MVPSARDTPFNVVPASPLRRAGPAGCRPVLASALRASPLRPVEVTTFQNRPGAVNR